MIISASRRTDIPAYYAEWFYNRIKEGYCTVPNPFNMNQVSVVNLNSEFVDAIVFWTRNPYPIFKYLDKISKLGYKYYFHFTINNLPKIYEPYNPTLKNALSTFQKLSELIGRGKVIWRYDPIFLTDDITVKFHINNFSRICKNLNGFTKRVVISIVDDYKKTLRRLYRLNTGYSPNQGEDPDIELLLKEIVGIAAENKIEVQSCAEAKDYSYLGIKPGKCIDDDIIRNELGVNIKYKKDKSQRSACRCTVSKDIGINNTCLMGCEYCYATTSHKTAVNNRAKHDSESTSIIPHLIDKKTRLQIQKVNEF